MDMRDISLRFVNYNRENPEYVLPQVKGIYPNMARVVNINTVTEEFYLDDMDNALQIQLSQQNLLESKGRSTGRDASGASSG